MRTVRDADGNTYLLLKESDESSRVRDPETGEERHLPNEELDVVDGEAPLDAAATAVPESVRAVVRAAHDDTALGFLVELYHDGPLAARYALDAYDCCESDLFGMVSEFRMAGLVEQTETPTGEGYALTETGERAVEALLD